MPQTTSPGSSRTVTTEPTKVQQTVLIPGTNAGATVTTNSLLTLDSQSSLYNSGGNGAVIPFSPDAYGLTWGNINENDSVSIDINGQMNPSESTLTNTVIYEGTHGLGGGEDIAYPLADALSPPISSP